MAEENQFHQNIQADRNSVEVGRVEIGGNLDGNLIIGSGNTVGYSPEQVSQLIKQISNTFQAKPFDGTCPYKGLDYFEEEDAELFFGREKLVEVLVGKIKDSRTVFITGPSGSGKSSLVRAGLIHTLKQGRVKGSENWLYATMKPGRAPIDTLARTVAGLVMSTNAEDEIRVKAPSDASIFARWCEIALKDGRDKKLVLFIDQFEEVFTQVNHEDERTVFLNMLTHAADAENGRVILLFAMRSDFVPNCAVYPDLNAALNRQFIQIGSMQSEELVSAIAQPALRVGLKVEPELIAQIINDMKGEPGALPLMSFALKDLFDKKRAKGGMVALTLNGYFENKGINEALQHHADAALAQLNEHEKKLAQSIFGNLIEIGRGTLDTKRTVVFNELVLADSKPDEVKAVVQRLEDARLVTTEEGSDKLTITHEKLIDAWPWLKKLINENRNAITLQNEIASAAKEWEENKRDISYLYSGGRLANIWEQVQKKKLDLGQLAYEFVKTGRRRQQKNRAAIISAVSFVLITAIVASAVFQNQAIEAEKLSNIALSRQLVVQMQYSVTTESSKQAIALLLASQSMILIPNKDAANFLINNNNLARPISQIKHEDSVRLVIFSPDGKYVVSSSNDGDRTARVWEAVTGNEIARMTHDDAVLSVAFSPDGNYVVSGGGTFDKTARVWETITGNEIARMTYNGFVSSVTFSPDGKYIVSGSYDGTVRVWESATGKEISRMTHYSYVESVVFSLDGKFVVSGSYDGTVLVWEAATGNEISRMTHDGHVPSVALSPDGKYVISGSSDRTARIWEASTGKEIARITHDGYVSSVAFSPDGNYAVSGSYDGTARVWEATTGKEIALLTHISNVNSVGFSPDGKYVVSGSSDRTARVWEATTGKNITNMVHDNMVNSFAFSHDGKFVVSGSSDGTARVWEITTGTEVSRMIHNGSVYLVAFSPDGKHVASGGSDRTIRVWEAATGKEIALLTHISNVNSVGFSPDGKYVVSGSSDRTARVWEATTGKEIARMTHDDAVLSVAFSPNGKYAVSGSYDGTARVWEATTGKEIARMTHDGYLNFVAFNLTGKYVISGSDGLDDNIRVWEATTGSEIVHMTIKYPSNITSIAISPDGKYIVSGDSYGTIQEWETTTGNEIAHMSHDGSVSSITFSPDGNYAVSGGSDGIARVWEITTGNEIISILHEDGVNSVAFSPDAKYVITRSEDTLRVWEWKSEDLIANTCAVMPNNLTRAQWNIYIGDALPYQAICDNLPIEEEIVSAITANP